MRSEVGGDDRNPGTWRWAQITCLVLGMALLVWGLAPAVVARIVTREAPALTTFALGALTMLLGVSFLGLSVLISRRTIWALWAALGLSVALILGNLALAWLVCDSAPSVFPLLLAGATAGMSWLALDASRRAERPEQPTNVT
jgi:zinc transporter ZupT